MSSTYLAGQAFVFSSVSSVSTMASDTRRDRMRILRHRNCKKDTLWKLPHMLPLRFDLDLEKQTTFYIRRMPS